MSFSGTAVTGRYAIVFFGTAARSRCEFFEYHQAASREPSAATHIYLRFTSSITRPRRGNPPLQHKYLLMFEVFHTLQLREAAMRLRVAPGRVDGAVRCHTHIYLHLTFPNFRTRLLLRVVNHRCDDSPLVFSAQRCNAPVPVTTGQQDKGTRDALL